MSIYMHTDLQLHMHSHVSHYTSGLKVLTMQRGMSVYIQIFFENKQT